MFEYELQQIRSAELIREAENDRMAREARRGRRAARESEGYEADGEAYHRRPRRYRFARAA